jgi:hypothetical protein
VGRVREELVEEGGAEGGEGGCQLGLGEEGGDDVSWVETGTTTSNEDVRGVRGRFGCPLT